ncbi:2-oxoglutarate-dependent dioxygenase-like protein [Paramyrothecium foliicola]|nr:2-oxoglutarate-dependent dioxygenase-like protein [Paramyrothecium foliicola]
MTSNPGFTEIPRIDLALVGNVKTEAGLLLQLRSAITDVGFLYIVNHGVPTQIITDLKDALPRLFALSSEAKDKVALANSPHFLGYSGDASETTAGLLDRREQFEFANELTATWTEGLPLYDRLRGPNQWPSVYPDLKQILERYMKEMNLLGERFLRLIAKCLLLSEDTFLSFLSDQHRIKLVHYPAVEGSPERQGVGPHKDSSGWWTFLLQASPPHINGLQVLNKAGSWIDVPVIPESFVVNIGQAFEVVTNGVCKATTHRVLSSSSNRYSVPFFQGVRRNLTKDEAVNQLKDHFGQPEFSQVQGESTEGREIDSPFLRGKYETWGESQLRTKIRSHQHVGRKFYGSVFDKYMKDD